MENYNKIVDKFAKEKVNAEISNGHILHAEHLLSTMIRYANKEINIFSGELKKSLFESQKFLSWVNILLNIKENVKLNVIVQDLTDDELKKHKLYRLVSGNHAFDKVSFFIANENTKAKIDKQHFATMDDSAYREEVDHENVKASANFNDPNKTKELIDKFELYKRESTKIN